MRVVSGIWSGDADEGVQASRKGRTNMSAFFIRGLLSLYVISHGTTQVIVWDRGRARPQRAEGAQVCLIMHFRASRSLRARAPAVPDNHLRSFRGKNVRALFWLLLSMPLNITAGKLIQMRILSQADLLCLFLGFIQAPAITQHPADHPKRTDANG